MANPEHLEKLRQGVKEWNRWRNRHERERPDLSAANLISAELTGADLSGANLEGAYLLGANLTGATLIGTRLSEALLGRAALDNANLCHADLRAANLNYTHLHGAQLKGANLTGATLIGAHLGDAHLGDADLGRARLFGAYLGGTLLNGARLEGTDFTSTTLYHTTFVDNDLSAVKGLEVAKHQGPSGVSIDTIYKSQGNIPEVFLRGCGVPDDFITYMRSLTVQPIQFYSCFISYSSKDQGFAERLHADLQAKGVRVWFAPHDMPIGARIRPAIDESIRVHDKLLLVLSEHSVSSQWVEQEVETALRKERRPGGGTVLFPVRLDDTVLEAGEGWPALVKDTRHIGDFTRWKSHDDYQKAFDRLLRDLKAEA